MAGTLSDRKHRSDEPLRIAHHHKHTPAALDAMLTLSGWRPCAELAAPDRPLRLWLCEPL